MVTNPNIGIGRIQYLKPESTDTSADWDPEQLSVEQSDFRASLTGYAPSFFIGLGWLGMKNPTRSAQHVGDAYGSSTAEHGDEPTIAQAV